MNPPVPIRYRVLLLLFFLTLITYLDRISISLVGVRIKTEFNLTNEQFGWVLAAFSLAYALFEIPAGALGDRIGQRAMLTRIVSWWSVFTAITGLTTGLYSLIGVRFLFGMGEAGAYPNSTGVVSRWFPRSETARGLSALFIGQNAGSAIAPLIVVPLAVAFGWRVPFFINGFIGLIWVWVCYTWFRDNPSDMKGITAEEKNLIEKNRGFISHQPRFPWRLALKNRSLMALVIAFFCSQWGQYFFVAWMPVYLQEGRHFAENDMKVITSYFFVVGIIGVLSAGYLSDRLVKNRGLQLGRRSLGMLAMGLMALSFLATALATSDLLVIISLYAGQLLYSFIPVVSFATCVDIGGNRAATVAGIMNFFGQMGAFFLAIVFGKMADLTQSYTIPLFIVAAVLLVGSLAWLFIDVSKPLVVDGKNA